MSSKKIQDINAEFQKALTVVSENNALKETVSNLLAEIDRLRGIDRSQLVKLNLSPEQEILDTQIHRIQQISRERTLTLEETKMLDLHIKNKKLLEAEAPSNPKWKDVTDSVPPEQLIEIAGSINEHDETSSGYNQVPSKKDPLE